MAVWTCQRSRISFKAKWEPCEVIEASGRIIGFIFGAQERNVVIRIDCEDEQTRDLQRNHLAGSAIPQAISRHILSHPQKRMAAKDKKGTTSGTENDRPSIEDLGKIFDEMTQERLGRRDPITQRWRRKTWAPPIWVIKSGYYNIGVGLPLKFVVYTLVDSLETDAPLLNLAADT
ncbi:unnamed protein product [Fusarium fujikuroi]|uniref:Uncharacterized protein n=1 Tax=Fusarium fujikuroi TaxID=5127 RepID=A0A9Q9RYZ7_FUSFU|nr:unnamed protein product [Fusarium fujikuroi]VZH99281.1 unnamed protein product [Fusarium fujikuroi]